MSYYGSSNGVWTRSWSDGTNQSGTFTRNAYSVSKATAVKRKKPTDLMNNRTAWTVSSWYLDSPITTRTARESGPPYRRFVENMGMSQHISLGQFAHGINSSQLELIAQNKALKSARNQGVNLANMLGEYRQASNLFVDLVTEFYRVTQAVIKKDPRILAYGYFYRNGKARPNMTKRTLKNLSEYWLAYMYGVKPLMNDMHDAMQQLRTHATRPLFERVDEYAKEEYSVTRYPLSSIDFTPCRVTDYAIYKVRALCYFSVRNDLLQGSLGAYGFTNPLSVAWELTPFSFVVDWWVNVGEVLESLDNAVYFDQTKSTIQFIHTLYGIRKGEHLGVTGTYEFKTYTRRAPTGIPSVTASFRTKLKPSLTHTANGLALLSKLVLDSRLNRRHYSRY